MLIAHARVSYTTAPAISILRPRGSPPLALGPQGVIDVRVFPSGIVAESGSTRYIQRGAAVPSFLLDLSAKTFHSASANLFGDFAFPSNFGWILNGSGAIWQATASTRDGTVQATVSAHKVASGAQAVDPVSAFRALSLFVPGVTMPAGGYVPVDVSFSGPDIQTISGASSPMPFRPRVKSAGPRKPPPPPPNLPVPRGIALGSLQLTFVLEEGDASLLEPPASFVAPSAGQWTSAVGAARTTTALAAGKRRRRGASRRATRVDPDVLESIRQPFLDQVAFVASTLLPAYSTAFVGSGFKVDVNWFTPLTQFLAGKHFPTPQAKVEANNILTAGLPLIYAKWAQNHIRSVGVEQFIADTRVGPVEASTIRTAAAMNTGLDWVDFILAIATAVTQLSTPAATVADVEERWFTQAVGTVHVDVTGALQQLSAASQQPGAPGPTIYVRSDGAQGDRVQLIDPEVAPGVSLGVDVTVSNMIASISLADQAPPNFQVWLPPGGASVNVIWRVPDVGASANVTTTPALTISNVVVGLLSGGLTLSAQLGEWPLTADIANLDLSVSLTPDPSPSSVGWNVAIAPTYHLSLMAAGISSSGLLTVLGNLLGFFFSPNVNGLFDDIAKKARRFLGAIGFPQTLMLFRGAQGVGAQRVISLVQDIPYTNFGGDVSVDINGMLTAHRYAAVDDGSGRVGPTLDALPLDETAPVSYSFSQLMVGRWIDSMVAFLTGTAQPALSIDWTQLLGSQPIPPSISLTTPVVPPPDDPRTPTDDHVPPLTPPTPFQQVLLSGALPTFTGTTWNQPNGQVQIPIQLQVGWQGSGLEEIGWPVMMWEIGGFEIDDTTLAQYEGATPDSLQSMADNGDQLAAAFLGGDTPTQIEVRYFTLTPQTDVFLSVQGSLTLNLFVGLDGLNPLGGDVPVWPVLRLALESPTPTMQVTIDVNSIQVGSDVKQAYAQAGLPPPFFVTATPAQIASTTKGLIEAQLGVLQALARDGNMQADSFFGGGSLGTILPEGYTIRTARGGSGNPSDTLMLTSDANQDLTVGVRLVSQLFGFPS
jgi:hypothetical protein